MCHQNSRSPTFFLQLYCSFHAGSVISRYYLIKRCVAICVARHQLIISSGCLWLGLPSAWCKYNRNRHITGWFRKRSSCDSYLLFVCFSGVLYEERTERSAKWQTGELSSAVALLCPCLIFHAYKFTLGPQTLHDGDVRIFKSVS